MKVYVYKEWNTGLPYGEEFIKVIPYKDDARRFLRKRIREDYKIELNEAEKDERFFVTDSKVEFTDNNGCIAYYEIEEHELDFQFPTENEIRKICTDGNKIVSELGDDPYYKEIFVYMETPSGEQKDICVIGEKYHYEDGTSKPVPEHGVYTVKVWGNPNVDSITNTFEIDTRR